MSIQVDQMNDLAREDEGEECGATASGIVHCLHMLAEEAAGLNLSRTLLAIHEALDVCRAEGAAAAPPRVLH